jgi:hypothetical protein
MTDEPWISVKEASDILTRNSGHEVTPGYVRWLIQHKKLTVKPLDERTNLVSRADVEKYRVRQHHSKREE